MTSSSASRNRSCAFTCTRSTANCSRNVSSTCSASPRRSKPGVDEHARELVADRLVHERGRDRGVDAARQPADHPLGADLGADLGDGVLDDRDVRPRGPAARGVEEERLEDLHAVLGVRDLGMELHAVDAAVAVFEPGDGYRVGARGHGEAGRRGGDRVAVAHPHDLVDREIGEQQRRALDVQLGAAVLALPGLGDLAAEIARDELRAVTDAEQRDTRRRRPRRRSSGAPSHVHRRGTAREDDRLRLAGEHLRDRHRARDDLAVDVQPRGRAGRSAVRTAPRSRRRGRGRAIVSSTTQAMPTPCARCSDLPSVCSAGATITSAFWNSFTVS